MLPRFNYNVVYRYSRRLFSTKTTEKIPSVPLELFAIPDASGNALSSVESRLEADIDTYSNNISHESGMLKGCPLNTNDEWLLPTNASTLQQMFQNDIKGTVHTAWYPHHIALSGGADGAMNALNGPRHKKVRHVFQPYFTDQALSARFSVIKTNTDNFINYVISKSKTNAEYLNMMELTQEWALKNVFGTIFDDTIFDEQRFQRIQPMLKAYILAWMDFDLNNMHKPNTLLGDGMIARTDLLHEITLMVNDCKKLHQNGTLDSKTIIYKMINDIKFDDPNSDNSISVQEFMDNLLLLVWAGHDTTASTACNAIYYLQEYGDGLVKELRENDGGVLEDYHQLMSHQKLDSFVREILRILPTVPSFPKLLTEDTVINGCPVDGGSIMQMVPVFVSRNENIFDDPNTFDPERFIKNEPSKQVWLPFGFGSHMCLGWKLAYMELKMLVAALALNAEIEVDPPSKNIAEAWFLYHDVNARFKSAKS